ncbi:GCN5-related N-acetyltransferase [Klebsiella quasipneumoniae]|uniref:MSMEG_0567/Sll0786 family nitrogen starvation N-acetyltransferase n=1 Tax=Klebsiella pneumoniae complex TaxID=3390273 RepID=UPI000DE71716|nr:MULTISPECIES: MSMEG_0567/Sll0786 family nitrogen starvation N-acetyltransferase [Klebsiella]SSF82731.1 GCN5-related N-acetyltransferase [Klebsiella pneumoniae]VGG57344.1 GCN5-related N-acetyltransferase [Klebsiella quasipneumoniae]HBX6198952.1 GNAT family N-acetyltransferase [Klebsiella pneumoniae]HDZ1695250.1 GNAT family N-acetyltransferase [Klebsiella pneumoniae]
MENYSGYTIKWVTLPWEREQAYALRQRVFCQEQRLFDDHDIDAIDGSARLIVALGNVGGWHEEVVGTVRINEDAPGVWSGSRLAVDTRFRRQGQLGQMLIRLAVCSAHALGCQQFFAQVQHQNEPLFRRMHWETLGWIELRGMTHAYMQANLDYYPACHDPFSGMVITSARRGRMSAEPTWLAGSVL